MVYDEDAEWTPSHEWRRKHSLEEAVGPRESANIRRAKTHTLEKIQEIKRAENLLADVDDAAISTNAFETFRSHHELSSVAHHSENKSNYSVAAIDEVLLPKPPLTLLKRDVIHKRLLNLPRPNLSSDNYAKHTTINQERAYRCMIPRKTILLHNMVQEERIENNNALLKLFQRRKKKDSPKKQSRKRRRIKPSLSVTIPESNLFPKKKHFIVCSNLIMAKRSKLKNNETKTKNYLKKIKTTSLKELRKINREVAQTKNDKNRKGDITSANFSKKLHLQLESLSNSELPIGLCKKGSINADHMANSPAQKPTNVSYTFETHFAAIQQYLENLKVKGKGKGKSKAQWIQDQGYGSKEDDRDTSCLKKNSTPWCYNIDDKDKPSGKLVLKIRRSNPQMEAEISRGNEKIEITNQSEGHNEENVTTEKNFTSITLKKISESTHPELSEPMIDVTASKEIQFINDSYRSISKGITLKMHELHEYRFGPVSETSENNDFTKEHELNRNCKTPKGSISNSILKKPEKDILSANNIICFQDSSCFKDSSRKTDVLSAEYHDQGDTYELLYEDFTKYYDNFFYGNTNSMCSEMGELLEYIVTKEGILFVEQVNADHNISQSGCFTWNMYNQIGQDKIKYLNKLFLQIYEKIFEVTDNVKQRKILLITCFVKMKSRVSSIANRDWTLKETRLHLITFLSQDILHLPLVGEVFFMHEETFLQDCMMVIDYTLKCKSPSVQESRIEVYKSKENDEITASKKNHHVFTNNQYTSSSANIAQYPNAEPSIGKRPVCEKELHLGKESSENIRSFQSFEESPCIEKQKEPCHINICNTNIHLEGQVKKVSTQVQALCDTYKNSSANKLEKLVERIRIGDIDLDYASCKIIEILRETDNFDEQYSNIQNKIDALRKSFNNQTAVYHKKT